MTSRALRRRSLLTDIRFCKEAGERRERGAGCWMSTTRVGLLRESEKLGRLSSIAGAPFDSYVSLVCAVNRGRSGTASVDGPRFATDKHVLYCTVVL